MNSNRHFRITLLNLIQIILIVSLFSCAEKENINSFAQDTDPWPSIRTERIKKLLPEAMQMAGVDAWIVICRENNNDPLAGSLPPKK